MNAPALQHKAAAFSMGGVMPVPVTGDYMEPTLCQRRDVALVAISNTWEGDGLYAIWPLVGDVPKLVRAQPAGKGKIQAWGDNKLYWPKGGGEPGDVIDRADFLHDMMGKVRGVISIYDPADWRAYVDMIEGRAS